MDEMKLNLGSKIMRRMASKMIAKMIYKRTGYKINIDLNALKVSYIDGDTVIKTDVELKMDSREFTKMIKNVDIYDI